MEVGVHCVARLLEDKQSRRGRTVMFPFLPTSKFESLAYYCDPLRLIFVDRGSFEVVA